jgi:hypothetical protein
MTGSAKQSRCAYAARVAEIASSRCALLAMTLDVINSYKETETEQ